MADDIGKNRNTQVCIRCGFREFGRTKGFFPGSEKTFCLHCLKPRTRLDNSWRSLAPHEEQRAILGAMTPATRGEAWDMLERMGY